MSTSARSWPASLRIGSPTRSWNARALQNPFSAGYDDIDPAFRSWLLVHREGLHQKLTRGLEDQLANAPSEGSQARRLADALIHLDATTRELLRLIRSYADAGHVSEHSPPTRSFELLGDEYRHGALEQRQELIAAIKSGLSRHAAEHSPSGRELTHLTRIPPFRSRPPTAFPSDQPLKLVLPSGPLM